jgi:hypothetical protein
LILLTLTIIYLSPSGRLTDLTRESNDLLFRDVLYSPYLSLRCTLVEIDHIPKPLASIFQRLDILGSEKPLLLAPLPTFAGPNFSEKIESIFTANAEVKPDKTFSGPNRFQFNSSESLTSLCHSHQTHSFGANASVNVSVDCDNMRQHLTYLVTI